MLDWPVDPPGAPGTSRQLLDQLIEHSPAAIALLDRDMRYLSASRRYSADYRLQPQDLVGRSHYEVFPEIPERWKEVHRRCLAGATENADADPFIRADGAIDLVRWEIQPWRDEGGAIGGIIIFSEVITEHKRARVALKQSEKFYRTILEDVPDLICRWRPDGTITYANRNFCSYFGKTAEELVGNTFVPRVPEDDRERVTDKMRSLGSDNPVSTVEHPVVLPNGEVRWQEWVHRSLLDGVGCVREIQSTGRDITEHKESRDQLRVASLIIENSPVVVFRWRISADWPVTYASENVSQWGYSPQELTDGRVPFRALIPPGDWSRLESDTLRHIGEGIDNFASEYRIVTRAGEVRWVEELTTVQRDAGGTPLFLQGILRDINGRKLAALAAERRAARTLAQGRALTAIAISPAIAAGDVERLAREITEACAGVTGVERANVWLFNEAETELRCIDLYEATPDRHSSGVVLKEDQFGNEFAALKASPYVNADEPLTDPRTAGYVESYFRPLRITSMLDAVVEVSGRRLGLLCLEHVDRPHHWEPDEIEFACRVADKIGLALSNRETQQAQKQLLASLEQTIRAIANVVEVRDPFTAGHQQRVAALAAAIARELGMSEDRIHGLQLAATVHDVGKIQVPADILNKPSTLSAIEVRFIHIHSQVGHDILKDVSFPWPIAEVVLQHHERMDGSGYPRGLKGDEIMLEARIIAVADVVEAMASHRPYRPAFDIQVALREIEANAGVLYDADVARVCLRLFREMGYKL
jgi:PAS domain S-box-containing protein